MRSVKLAVAILVVAPLDPLLAQGSPKDKAAVVRPEPAQRSPDRAVVRPRWTLQSNCRISDSVREMKGPGETMPLRASQAVPYALTATSVRMPADFKVVAKVCIGNQDHATPIDGALSVVLDAEPFEPVGAAPAPGGWRVRVPTPIAAGGSRCVSSTRRSKVAPATVVTADVQAPDGRPALNVCRADVTRLESPLDDKAVIGRPSK